MSYSSTGGIPPPLNAILKTLNCPFAEKEDFMIKLSNISITFAYLLFSIMLKYFIKNHYSRSRDIRLHILGANWTEMSHMPQKRIIFWNYIKTL